MPMYCVLEDSGIFVKTPGNSTDTCVFVDSAQKIVEAHFFMLKFDSQNLLAEVIFDPTSLTRRRLNN